MFVLTITYKLDLNRSPLLPSIKTNRVWRTKWLTFSFMIWYYSLFILLATNHILNIVMSFFFFKENTKLLWKSYWFTRGHMSYLYDWLRKIVILTCDKKCQGHALVWDTFRTFFIHQMKLLFYFYVSRTSMIFVHLTCYINYIILKIILY